MRTFKEMYTDIKDVKAVIKTDWEKTGRTKFAPGDKVRIMRKLAQSGSMDSSGPIRNLAGRTGIVKGVTCTSDGTIRGASVGYCHRMYTKYYVKFGNGKIYGIHSHWLEEVKSKQRSKLDYRKGRLRADREDWADKYNPSSVHGGKYAKGLELDPDFN